MIAELGLAALWLATALALLQLIGGVAGLTRAGAGFGDVVRPSAVMQGVLVAAAFAALILCFATTDLSVKLVVANSHAAKPLIYKIAGTWGNHEGSMLLWVTIMAAAGALVARVEHRLPEPMLRATLAGQAFVSLGFYAFLLFASNPFARANPVPAEGNGLNPLLQDPGLAFHPPTLYLGYVGLSIAFSFAIGALVTGEVGPRLARAMRPWVLGAWVFLTLGITAGSYWAYYVLGWGGWWFWDPVENASLMPWLAATALLHSIGVLAARDALRVWTVMLGVLAFSMSMIGTFLVRSGILTSVHAFAVDPGRGAFILALLAIDIGGALLLFALRAGAIAEGKRFAAVSREGALVINNLLLTAILGIVLIGTLYPLVTEALGVRVSVGPPYFTPATALFALPMLAVVMVGPSLRWRRDRLARVERKLLAPLVVGLGAGIWVTLLARAPGGEGITPLAAIGLVLAPALAAASLLPLAGRSLIRTPLATYGMVLAHLGLAVSLFGMASDSAFSLERLVAARVGAAESVGPWRITFAGIAPVAGRNWTALEAELDARYAGGAPLRLTPQSRSFWAPVQTTSISALSTRWNGQLYAVLGEPTEDGRWQLRLWWKPFVPLIWLGGVLVAIGGMLALAGRLRQDIRRRAAAARRDRGRAYRLEQAR